jgi:hypothetical protein
MGTPVLLVAPNSAPRQHRSTFDPVRYKSRHASRTRLPSAPLDATGAHGPPCGPGSFPGLIEQQLRSVRRADQRPQHAAEGLRGDTKLLLDCDRPARADSRVASFHVARTKGTLHVRAVSSRSPSDPERARHVERASRRSRAEDRVRIAIVHMTEAPCTRADRIAQHGRACADRGITDRGQRRSTQPARSSRTGDGGFRRSAARLLSGARLGLHGHVSRSSTCKDTRGTAVLPRSSESLSARFAAFESSAANSRDSSPPGCAASKPRARGSSPPVP